MPRDHHSRKDRALNPAFAAALVLDEVATWPGVSTQTTSRGSTVIVFAGRELGYLHPHLGTLDLPLSAHRRAAVLRAYRAQEWFSNWVIKPLADVADAQDGIALLRETYDELLIGPSAATPGAREPD
jgi:Family of unknown function (DUF5519)